MSKHANIGGQAVIEGVMMRGPEKIAIAVRTQDGNINVDVKDVLPLSKKNKIFSLPIVRGGVALIDSLLTGIDAITYSASFYEDGEEESKFDSFLRKIFKDKAEKVIVGISLILSLTIAIGMFIVLPTIIVGFIKEVLANAILINLIEGGIRLAIFLTYVLLISRLEDIRRVFEYHGAEHRSIHCFEKGLPLTPENAQKYSTLHPRCGTNFLLIVMVVSIFIFSFFGWPNIYMRIIYRLLLLPVVAGISYEVIKWLGKSDGIISRILAYPGLMLQKLTTREPDDSQVEVAIAALKAVLNEVDDNEDI